MSLDGEVAAVAATESGTLYIGGYFTWGSSTSLNHVARWDAINGRWLPLGGGVDFDGAVHALAVSGEDVYVGGSFNTVGGLPARGVARWDGTQWVPLGSGVNGTVFALAVSGGDLYAGGYLYNANWSRCVGFQKWNGSTWTNLGSGVNDTIYCCAVQPDGKILLGGSFVMLGGQAQLQGEPHYYLGRLNPDGTVDTNFTAGTNAAVTRILPLAGGEILVAGYFTELGAKPAPDWGGWPPAAAPFRPMRRGWSGTSRLSNGPIRRSAATTPTRTGILTATSMSTSPTRIQPIPVPSSGFPACPRHRLPRKSASVRPPAGRTCSTGRPRS